MLMYIFTLTNVHTTVACILYLTLGIDAVLVLMGTKLDIVADNSTLRQVPLSEAKGFSNAKHMVDAIETSSKEDKNIKQVFLKLAKELRKKHEGIASTMDDPTVSIRLATVQLPDEVNKDSSKRCIC